MVVGYSADPNSAEATGLIIVAGMMLLANTGRVALAAAEGVQGLPLTPVPAAQGLYSWLATTQPLVLSPTPHLYPEGVVLLAALSWQTPPTKPLVQRAPKLPPCSAGVKTEMKELAGG